MSRFVFQADLCTGCYACEVACRQWHDTPLASDAGCHVTCHVVGTFPEVTREYTRTVTAACNLCADQGGEPRCAITCPTGALTYN